MTVASMQRRPQPSCPPSTKTTHYASLDALRGLAAIAVMLGHVGANEDRLSWGVYGYLAVDLFFMMSGFVVARAYEKQLSTSLSVSQFVKVRILRLYPALALGVLVAVVCRYGAEHPSVTVWMIIKHLLLLPSLDGGDLFPLNPVLWSLFFELVINIVHAAVLPWLSTRRVAVAAGVCCIGFLAVIWVYHGPGVGWGGSTFLAGFPRAGWSYLVGVLIARWHRFGALVSLSPLWPVGIATVLLFAPNLGFASIRVLATVFMLFPLIVLLAVEARSPRIGSGVCQKLGGMSYPLYTIHFPLVVIATTLLGPFPGVLSWTIVLAAITGLALAIEVLYDAPIRLWLRRC